MSETCPQAPYKTVWMSATLPAAAYLQTPIGYFKERIEIISTVITSSIMIRPLAAATKGRINIITTSSDENHHRE